MVTSQQKAILPSVVQGQGELPVQAGQKFAALLLVQVNQHLHVTG